MITMLLHVVQPTCGTISANPFSCSLVLLTSCLLYIQKLNNTILMHVNADAKAITFDPQNEIRIMHATALSTKNQWPTYQLGTTTVTTYTAHMAHSNRQFINPMPGCVKFCGTWSL